MTRLIMFLLGKNYEPCKSCATLEKQLEYEVAKNKELTETLISILKPKVVEAAPVEVANFKPVGVTFSRRRAILEEQERQKSKVLQNNPLVAKSDDSIQKLEEELGVEKNG